MKRLVLIVSVVWLQGCSSLSNLWDLVSDEEQGRIRDAARAAAACKVSEVVQAPMRREELFAWWLSRCEPVDLNDPTQLDLAGEPRQLYSDRFCRHPVNYQHQPYYRFCSEYGNPQRLGENLNQPESWSLNPATRMRLPLISQRGLYQPYLLRSHYKSIKVGDQHSFAPLSDMPLQLRRGSGVCELEMRIYKRGPASDGLKPLMIFHSGGWRQRGYHLMALESRIAEFTDNGFMVFVPFNRMTGEGGASAACSRVGWQEVREDALSALTWVERNAPLLGGDGSKVRLMAQGIGAIQAGWLLDARPEAIEKSLLLYPMMDSRDMLSAYQSGRWQHPSSSKALTQLLQVKALAQVDPMSQAVAATSLADRLAAPGRPLPPLRILHGLSDKRIPVSQSVGVCNAYAGGQVATAPFSAATISCGEGAQLQLFTGAKYHLDYCLAGVECPAGKPEQRAKVRAALEDARQWLAEENAR